MDIKGNGGIKAKRIGVLGLKKEPMGTASNYIMMV